jgi:hypothetical protein
MVSYFGNLIFQLLPRKLDKSLAMLNGSSFCSDEWISCSLCGTMFPDMAVIKNHQIKAHPRELQWLSIFLHALLKAWMRWCDYWTHTHQPPNPLLKFFVTKFLSNLVFITIYNFIESMFRKGPACCNIIDRPRTNFCLGSCTFMLILSCPNMIGNGHSC